MKMKRRKGQVKKKARLKRQKAERKTVASAGVRKPAARKAAKAPPAAAPAPTPTPGPEE